MEPLSNITDIGNYLSDVSGGVTDDDPILLPVDIDLADASGNGWADLLDEIADANGGSGVYVALDLSTSTMSGMTGTPGEFDPGTANTGEQYIVSLVLPDEVESIKDVLPSPFQYFSSLKDLIGKNVAAIVYDAFSGCTALTTVSLPEATTIGLYAFKNCTALTTVNLPAAIIIDQYAFENCTALTTVSLPAVTTIGQYAFSGCTFLETVDLPEAAYIATDTFNSCTALTTLYLPASPPLLWPSAFRNTGSSGTLEIVVPPGSVSAYTAFPGWNVAADTAAGGDTSTYGSNHKRIVITGTL
jgi:hypothetical protein